MTPPYRLLATSAFERLYRKLERKHPDLSALFAQALAILASDPLNRTRKFAIRKLVNIKPGEGQFRLRLGRWRFRYDIAERDVVLQYCGLRREDTYRQE
ncbi:MAG: type II toxin-antitoxin system RelE family toxin [Candidatus Acidiferrales bacterium]